jgi:hypothetical protein
MNKPHTRRILKIGNKLVKGPDAIFNIQGRDWVEKDLQIIFYKPDLANIESFSIWSDRTMNKYKNFLPPLIRMLKWDRKTDMENLRLNQQRDFPMIELDLGLIISDKFEEVSQKFIVQRLKKLNSNKNCTNKTPRSMKRKSLTYWIIKVGQI